MHAPFRLAHRFLIACAALALCAAPLGAEDPAPPAPPSTPAEVAKALAAQLKHVHMGEGLVAEEVVLFPLYVLTAPPPLDLAPAITGTPFRANEIEGKAGTELVRVMNPGPKTSLLLGGSVLEGGKRDRIVKHDVLIPSADARDVEVTVGSMSSDVRNPPAEFKLQDFLAPPYLREAILFSNSKSIVPKFVSHFLDFRNPSDKRKSLAAIGDADALADYCLVCQRTMAEWPEKKGAGTVVGGISVVRGRVQALELFATNEQLAAFFSPILKSLTFPAAAIALKAKKLNIQLPRDDESHVKKGQEAAKELMAALPDATYDALKDPEGALGMRFLVKLKDGTRGGALALDGRLVHLALFANDAFDRSLYAQALEPLAAEDVTDDGDGGDPLRRLEQRSEAGARLTESEKQLLERLRKREDLGSGASPK
jgi:hypothetical protein